MMMASDLIALTLLHSTWQILLLGLVNFLIRKVVHSANAKYWGGVVCLFLMPIASIVTLVCLNQQQSKLDLAAQSINTLNEMSVAQDFQLKPAESPAHEAVASNTPPTATSNQVAAVYSPSSNIEPANPEVDPTEPVFSPEPTLTRWFAYSWLVGVMMFSIRPFLGYRYVQRVSTQGLIATPDSLNNVVKEFSHKLRISVPQISLSNLIDVPLVVGIFKPTILIPASMMSNLTPAEIELIVRHELAHIKRFDLLVNLVQTLIETLLFFHPVVWWLSSQIRIERENCCDDLAVSNKRDAIVLAGALTRLAESRLNTLVVASNGGKLYARIARLVGENKACSARQTQKSLLASMAVIGVLVISASNFLISSGGEDSFDDAPVDTVVSNWEASKLAPMNHEIAWGETNQNGFKVGVSLEPKKEVYSTEERVRVLFHVQNNTGSTLDLTVPRVAQPVMLKWRATDENGSKVETTNAQELQWIAGYTGIRVEADKELTVWGPYVQFRPRLEGDNKDEMLINIGCQPNKNLTLDFDLSQLLPQQTEGCSTGQLTIPVARGVRAPQRDEMVVIRDLAQLKDTDPAVGRIRLVVDQYEVDSEWLQVIAERFPNLWELDLGECRSLTDDDIKWLSKLGNLVALRINFAEKLRAGSSQHLSGLNSLRFLDLSYCEKWICDETVSNLVANENLHTLILRRHSANGCGIGCVNEFSKMKNLRHVIVTQQQPLASAAVPAGSNYQLHIVNDRPSDDFYSRDFSNIELENGLELQVSVAKNWKKYESRFPTIDLSLQSVGDEITPEASELLNSIRRENFQLEFDGRDFELNHHEYRQPEIRDVTNFQLELVEHFWMTELKEHQISGRSLWQQMKLEPRSHQFKVRLKKDGKVLGASQRMEFFVAEPSQTWAGKFNDDEFGDSTRKWMVAAKTGSAKINVGDLPVVDVRVKCRVYDLNERPLKFGLVGHSHPSAFDVVIDGELFEFIEFQYPADWMRVIEPGGWMDSRLILAPDRYKRREVKRGTKFDWPLHQPGKHTIEIVYSEPKGNPSQATSKKFEIEVVADELDQAISQAGSWTTFDWRKENGGDRRYRCETYLEIAQMLQRLEPHERIARLKTWAFNESLEEQTIILCRMLFAEREGKDFRRPYLGGAFFVSGDYADWKREPIELVDGIPLLVVRGYALGGRAEPARKYLAYCVNNCDWSGTEYGLASDKQLSDALEKLIDEKSVDDETSLKFLRQQVTR